MSDDRPSPISTDQARFPFAPLTFSPISIMASRLGPYWWAVLALGIIWIGVGFAVIQIQSAAAVLIASILGAMVAFSAIAEIVKAVATPGRWRVWHSLFATLLFISAIVVLINPLGTFAYLALIIGFYFVFAGTFDVISGLFAVHSSTAWWLQLVSGALQIVLGYFASSSLEAGAALLVTFVSIAALFRGVADIGAAFAIRSHRPVAGRPNGSDIVG